MKSFLLVLMITVFFLVSCSENTDGSGTDVDDLDQSDVSDWSEMSDSDKVDTEDEVEDKDAGNDADRDNVGDNTPDPETETVKLVAAGSAHVCAIKDSGHLYCWGQGNLGQLGNNQTPGGDNANTNPISTAGINSNQLYKSDLTILLLTTCITYVYNQCKNTAENILPFVR